MKWINNENQGFTLVELMIVIIVVGVLASVAIPRFLDAAQKSKASEFPTQLSAIYTGQMAYNSEQGTYVTSLVNLRDSAGVDVPSSSRWFTYSVSIPGIASFTGTATVNSPGFGQATNADYATIDQTNSKYCTNALKRYCPSWR